MELCEKLGVDYVPGLAKNANVCKHVQAREATTKERCKRHFADTEKKLRQFDTFSYGAKSWGKKRRVIVRFEVGPQGATRAST